LVNLYHVQPTESLVGKLRVPEVTSVALAVRRDQRVVFIISLIVGAIPIFCQGLMLAAVHLDATAFPSADRTFLEAKFWPIQIALLCIAIAGNAMVAFIKTIWRRGVHAANSVWATGLFLVLAFCFLLVSLLFSVTLLDSGSVGSGS
jgi:hypothetical protein